MGKKKQRLNPDEETEPEPNPTNGNNEDSHSDKNLKLKKKKNKKIKTNEIPTVSIAVPASIIDNVPTLELATRYLETPQYLRKALFPMHNSLRFVGMLPPLDAPHHLRKHEWGPYREGVTIKERHANSGATLVDVGLFKHVAVDQILEPGKRVTVAMGANRNLDSDLPREVVSSSKPREEGAYWGYQVRYAHNISSVFNECTYKGGYDCIIGTSEHGQIIKSSELEIPSFRHLLIAFGGLAGLEESIEEDDNFKGKNAKEVFNLYLNTCPHQGSRTIRTEEAILISLQYFQEPISRAMLG
ncbi:putative methyltransferase C9orf114 [Trifolium repens]|nr:putative methyltransferase C9orf114 [Trifolium repens]